MHALELEKPEPQVVLGYAKVVRDKNADKNAVAERPVERLTLPMKDIAHLLAKDVRLSPDDVGPREDYGFETDSAISRGRGG